MNGILCYCNNCPGSEDFENGTCYLKPGGQCFSAVEEIFDPEKKEFEPVRTFGCISQNDHAVLQCHGDLVPSYYGQSIKCCNYTDLCNKYLRPHYKPLSGNLSKNLFFEEHWLFIALLSAFVLSFLLLFAYITFIVFKHKKEDRSRKYLTKTCNIKLQKSHYGLHDYVTSSGTGVGKPLLIQTTIGRQIKRTYCLGRGRFTEVYLGDWNARKIVEKIFSTVEEERWFREKKIYETALLRHDNVLGYISSDILDTGLRAIYTDYHQNGSLHDYLDKTCLNYVDFFLLVKSAATGIAHLHTEILGTLKRPAVAHCDITSKNFLINNCKECVISNFEIAIMHISTEDDLEMEPDLTSGTPRYMAPEVINGTINTTSFAAFKMADIYSLGLVFYEICQRCATVEGNRYTVEDHSLPFSNVLPRNPTIEHMRQLYTKKSKEELIFIPSRWENDTKVLKPFTGIMKECLYENPKARPSALRLRKSVITLMNSNLERNVDIL